MKLEKSEEKGLKGVVNSEIKISVQEVGNLVIALAVGFILGALII